MPIFNLAVIVKACVAGSLVLSLAACNALVKQLEAKPVDRVTAQNPLQACDAPEQNELRLVGAFLRNSEAAGDSYVPLLIGGRSSRNAIDPDVTLNDLTQIREIDDLRGTLYEGPKKAGAVERTGFGTRGVLPNVYDVTYASKDIDLSGPLVAGPGAFFYEIPSSGTTVFSGTIAVEVITKSESGETQSAKATGRFAMQAGYGSGRGALTANAFDGELPFDTLNWSGLYLCGTRFISSGQGVVTVQSKGGPALPPFKADRDPAAYRALFESSLMAAVERPAPPTALGGVFVIQSNNGTMTAVFLSDQAATSDDTSDEEAGSDA